MAVITYDLATDIIIPHITVERQYIDGVHMAYRLTTHEGYVMYRTDADDTIWDEVTEQEMPITYYYRMAVMNVRVPVENWTWVAVPENDVPADQIFGGGNDHEVM